MYSGMLEFYSLTPRECMSKLFLRAVGLLGAPRLLLVVDLLFEESFL